MNGVDREINCCVPDTSASAPTKVGLRSTMVIAPAKLVNSSLVKPNPVTVNTPP